MPLNIVCRPPTSELSKIAEEMWTVEAETLSSTYLKQEYHRIFFNENRAFSTLYEESYLILQRSDKRL